MKKTRWLFLIVALAIFAIAPLKFAAGAQSREFRKTVEFAPGGDLRFNTDKGSVRLTAWDQSRVEIYARIDAPEDVEADYGRRAVDAVRIEVISDARSLTIRSNFDDVPYRDGKGEWRSLPDIHYEIRAPRNLNLDLGADRCKVEAQGFAGRIRIATDRTPVTANDLSGEIQVRMDRGKATITRFQGKLDLQIAVEHWARRMRNENPRLAGPDSQLASRPPRASLQRFRTHFEWLQRSKQY
jgi:hypothetical protein